MGDQGYERGQREWEGRRVGRRGVFGWAVHTGYMPMVFGTRDAGCRMQDAGCGMRDAGV